jgi:peroxiredoxin Q/BCP
MRIAVLFTLLAFVTTVRAAKSMPPQVGELAPNFTLSTLEGNSVELAPLLREKPVLLVVLRGWPGYQCPLCTRQVREFVARSSDLAAQGAQVLMVYPGPAENLRAHAQEFLTDKQWPAEFLFVIDPNYSFTNRYGLRWEAKGETAYPSTFVIDQAGKTRFTHISHTHGDRVNVATALKALQAAK